MERLIPKHQDLNSIKEYNRIYFKRAEKDPDVFDVRRWNLLLKHYKGGRLIDIGCLDSQVPFLAKAIDSTAEIWGLDQAHEAIEDMEIKYPKILWHKGDLYNTKFKEGYFSYVVLGEVLEHLEDPYKAINEALRILRKGGYLAISVPFNEAIEPGAVDKHRHIWSFTQKDIETLVYPHKVKFKILGSQYLPVYKYHFPNLIAFIKKGE